MARRPKARWKVGDQFQSGIPGLTNILNTEVVVVEWNAIWEGWLYKLKNLADGQCWPEWFKESQVLYVGPLKDGRKPQCIKPLF